MNRGVAAEHAALALARELRVLDFGGVGCFGISLRQRFRQADPAEQQALVLGDDEAERGGAEVLEAGRSRIHSCY